MLIALELDEYVVIAALSALALVIGALFELRRDNRHAAQLETLEDRVRCLEIEFARESGRREPEGGDDE